MIGTSSNYCIAAAALYTYVVIVASSSYTHRVSSTSSRVPVCVFRGNPWLHNANAPD